MSAPVRSVIRAAHFTLGSHGWGLPLLLEGPPGVGKTAQIESDASACGLEPVTVLASIRAPEDFAGLPVPDGAGSLSRLPDAWARVANAAPDGAVVFFDEINHAPPAVLAALLRVINERCVGDLPLARGVRVIAAQNATSEGGGADLPAPLANRFGHVRWGAPSAGEWAEWLMGGATESTTSENAPTIEARVIAAWPVAFARARSLVSAFIKAQPGLLHVMPPQDDPRASKAWPSPRTWELATRALASSEIHGLDSEARELFVAAFVGEKAATSLALWASKLDLPDCEAILDRRAEWSPDPRRPDVTDVVLGSLVALTVATVDPASKRTRGVRTFELLGTILGGGAADVAWTHASLFVRSSILKDSEVVKAATPVLAKLHKVSSVAVVGVAR